MCQPKAKGGQRCAAHARIALQSAITGYQRDRTSLTAYERLQRAYADYAATPGGQVELENRLAQVRATSDEAINIVNGLRRGAHLRDAHQAVRAATHAATGTRPGSADTGMSEDTLRAAAALNAHLDPDKREAFLTDPHATIRAAMAQRADLTVHEANRLADDTDPTVRHAVAEHPITASSTLARLLDDADPRVAATADRVLTTRAVARAA